MCRTRLTAPLTLYVSNCGSDANDGLSPSTAWLTPQYAVDRVACDYDMNGYQLDIQLVSDSVNKYPPFQLKNYLDAGTTNQSLSPRILGDMSSTASHCVDGSGSVAAIYAVGVMTPWLIQGVKMCNTAGSYGLLADFYSKIYLKGVEFGNSLTAHCMSVFGSCVEFLTDPTYPLVKITGSSVNFAVANLQSMLIFQAGSTICFSGSPVISGDFVVSQMNSMTYYGSPSVGAATIFRRFNSMYNSGIQGAPSIPAATNAGITSVNSYSI